MNECATLGYWRLLVSLFGVWRDKRCQFFLCYSHAVDCSSLLQDGLGGGEQKRRVHYQINLLLESPGKVLLLSKAILTTLEITMLYLDHLMDIS